MTDRRREAARERYERCCAYCGVHEELAGATLTVDHHRSRSRGGSDDEDNLVYACPRCNEHKGPYWHTEDPPHIPLLHPGRDDLACHLQEDSSGRLSGLTSEGRFFIERLRLNRAPLVAHRLRLRAAAVREAELASARRRVADLERHIAELRADAESTTEELHRLSTPKRRP